MTGLLRDSTPVEQHGERVWVKREDLCGWDGAPALTKLRGIVAAIASSDAPLIGVVDGKHSNNGWATAAACKQLGRRCEVYWQALPVSGSGHPRTGVSQLRAAELGATLCPQRSLMLTVVWSIARKSVVARGGLMLNNAMCLPETVRALADEVHLTPGLGRFDHLVIPVGSGTQAAGILLGFMELGLHPHVWLYCGYTRKTSAWASLLNSEPALRKYGGSVQVVDEGWVYGSAVRCTAPFPASPNYEAKAWDWLMRGSLSHTSGDILFWNLGQ